MPVYTKWHKEVDLFAQIKSGIILEGNIQDIFVYPEGALENATVPLAQYLFQFFADRNYGCVIHYDLLHGFTCPDNPEMIKRFSEITSARLEDNGHGMNCIQSCWTEDGRRGKSAPELVAAALSQTETATAIIMDMASRYVPAPDRLQKDEVKAFTVLQQAIAKGSSARGNENDPKPKKNIVILLTNKQNDLPAWFFLGNPAIKALNVGYPTHTERRQLLSDEKGFRSFFAPAIVREELQEWLDRPEDRSRLIDRFVARTEGFTNYEMTNLRSLCRNMKMHINELCSVVDLYTYGIRDNPWQSPELMKKLEHAESDFRDRVKGQDAAISQTMDVIKRSVVGISGATSGKPKGVLFFAGPTGTGKTETAKTLAQIIFGDEKSCIRFDMSEYSQSHSDQRLLGAPPGYVGYEAGGQLTNAVRQNPFSILLFDEIEKAAPSIMDKFLQILEDGRMTDGQGNTVYFSESIIIFTSNLGMTVDGVENVTMDMPYEEVSKRVKAAIENHFKLSLGRPEILNRIGENVVVYDFIREDVALQILSARMEKIRKSMQDTRQIQIDWDPQVMDFLLKKSCANLKNGGRGIMNVVESGWINPLSRYMFDQKIQDGAQIHVTALTEENGQIQVVCE